MTSDPWALQAKFYSIIIKRQAIIRSFPGGVEEFERVHSPGKNGGLFQIACMSLQDTEYVLARLNDAGVIPGKDIGVIDMLEGPLLECPGIAFRCLGDGFPHAWAVNVEVGCAQLETLAEPEAQPTPSSPLVQAEAAARNGPRRVIGTLIHHIYDEDEDMDEDERKPSLAERVLAAAAEDDDPKDTKARTLTIDYGYDCHSIELDGETVAKLIAGEAVSLDGQGFMHDEEGWFVDHWNIDLQEGTASFWLDNGADFPALKVCWDDGEAFGPTATAIASVDHFSRGQPSPPPRQSPAARQHTIRVRYIDSLLAGHGHWEDVGNLRDEHSIQVSGELVLKIRAGEVVRTTGQGWIIKDLGLVKDDWLFNERLPGSVAICLSPENGDEPQWLEAIAVWIDEELQPNVKGYFE